MVAHRQAEPSPSKSDGKSEVFTRNVEAGEDRQSKQISKNNAVRNGKALQSCCTGQEPPEIIRYIGNIMQKLHF